MTASSPPSGLNEKLVKRLAKLAKLAIDDAEVAAVLPELSSIVRHVDSLRAVNTTGVPPMTHGAPLEGEETAPPASTTPAATVLGRTAIASSAGFDADDGTVKVPKVID